MRTITKEVLVCDVLGCNKEEGELVRHSICKLCKTVMCLEHTYRLELYKVIPSGEDKGVSMDICKTCAESLKEKVISGGKV